MNDDGVMRLYNPDDRQISMIVAGTRVTIPARGSVNVSVRKGRELMKAYPQLTEDSQGRVAYGPEALAQVDRLDDERCRQCLRVMVAGQRPDLEKAVMDSESAKKS